MQIEPILLAWRGRGKSAVALQEARARHNAPQIIKGAGIRRKMFFPLFFLVGF